MKKLMKKIYLMVTGGIILLAPTAVFALPGQDSGLKLENPIKYNSIADVLNAFLEILIRLGTIVAVIMFIYAGFLYLTAQGDESKVKDAHKVFKNTIIGTAILLGAQAIGLIIKNTIGNVTGNSNLF
jgi:hypothetical protein